MVANDLGGTEAVGGGLRRLGMRYATERVRSSMTWVVWGGGRCRGGWEQLEAGRVVYCLYSPIHRTALLHRVQSSPAVAYCLPPTPTLSAVLVTASAVW